MNENELAAEVEKLCDQLGLISYHSPDSRKEKSGWPDYVIVGPTGFLFRELKSDTGRPSLLQIRVGTKICCAGGDWSIWRPEDLDDGTIRRELEQLAGISSQEPVPEDTELDTEPLF